MTKPAQPIDSWYCIRTRRYKESWVAHQLEELGNEPYLPLLRQQRRIRRQLKWVIEPLFTCYLFARFIANEDFHTVRHMPGVAGVVSTAEDGPLPVDERIITILRERSLNGYVETKPTPFFSGEKLEVVEGPFQGLKALFERELKAGERVAVLLEILSSWVRVELPRASVQRQSTVHPWQPSA
jgi:transcriptional antiterminator RfaH